MSASVVQSKLGTTGGSAPTVTLDAPATAGNLLVAFLGEGGTAGTITLGTPTGMTALTNASGGTGGSQRASRLFYKVAAGGEQTFTGATPSSGSHIFVVEYSGIVTSSPLDVENAVANASGTNTTPSVTPTASADRLFVCAWFIKATTSYSAETITGSLTLTERYDSAPTGGTGTFCDREVASTSGSYTGSATPATAAVNNGHIAVFKVAAGGVLTPITLNATMTLTAAMTNNTIDYRTMAVTATLSPAMAVKSSYFRTFALVATLAAAVVRVAKYPRSFAATTSLPATVAAAKTYPRSLAATATLSPSMARVGLFPRTMAVAATLTAAWLRSIFFKSLAVSMTLVPTMSRLAKYARTLAITSVLAPTMARVAAYSRTNAVTATLTATMTPLKSRFMQMNATTTLTPNLTRILFFARTFAVTATLAPAVLKKLVMATPLAVSSSLSATMARVATFKRQFDYAAAGVTYSDDFNRADGGLGSNWTLGTTGTLTGAAIAVVSNQAKASGSTGATNGGAYWNSGSISADQYSEIQVPSLPPTAYWVGAIVRADSTMGNHYLAIYFNNGGTYTIALYKMISGTWSQIGSNYTSFTATAGDIMRLSVSGTTLRIKLNSTIVITQTDSAISTGRPGIATAGTVVMDNFNAGDSSSGTLFAVTMTPIKLTGLKFQALDAFVTLTAAMTRIPILSRVFNVTATISPTLSRIAQFFRSFPVTSTETPTMTRVAKDSRTFPVTMTATPTMARIVSFFRSFAATTTLTPTMVPLKSRFIQANAVVTLTATMSRFVHGARTFAVTVVLTPTMGAASKFYRTFAATLIASPAMVKVSKFFRTLAVTMVDTAAMTSAKTYPRALAATTTLTGAMTMVRKNGRILAATVTLIPALSKVVGKSFAAGVVLTPAVARKVSYKLSQSLVVLPAMTARKLAARSFAATTTITPTMLKQKLARQVQFNLVVTFVADLVKDVTKLHIAVPIITGRVARMYAKVSRGSGGDVEQGEGGIEE